MRTWVLVLVVLAGCENGAVLGLGGEVEPVDAAPAPDEVDAAPRPDEVDAAPPATGRYHPDGFADPGQHGAQLKLQQADCRACHGAELTGMGAAPSCDTCHTPAEPQAWRSDCTFCHGGEREPSGAPPRGLAGADVFPAHTAHVTSAITAPLACVECHTQPLDVLSAGHVFDETPGVAEVDLAGGRSPDGVFASASGCSGVYCHGDGQGTASVEITAEPMTCASCHPSLGSGEVAWAGMSGQHRRHLRLGVDCGDCHRGVTPDGEAITGAAEHVDGRASLQFSVGGFAFDANARRCSGECHGEDHEGERW